MLQTIKNALNSSIVWVLALLAGILFLWRREEDLERQLEEEKGNATIKTEQEAVVKDDESAATSVADFLKLRDDYNAANVQPSDPSSDKGSAGPTDPNKGS